MLFPNNRNGRDFKKYLIISYLLSSISYLLI